MGGQEMGTSVRWAHKDCSGEIQLGEDSPIPLHRLSCSVPSLTLQCARFWCWHRDGRGCSWDILTHTHREGCQTEMPAHITTGLPSALALSSHSVKVLRTMWRMYMRCQQSTQPPYPFPWPWGVLRVGTGTWVLEEEEAFAVPGCPVPRRSA